MHTAFRNVYFKGLFRVQGYKRISSWLLIQIRWDDYNVGKYAEIQSNLKLQSLPLRVICEFVVWYTFGTCYSIFWLARKEVFIQIGQRILLERVPSSNGINGELFGSVEHQWFIDNQIMREGIHWLTVACCRCCIYSLCWVSVTDVMQYIGWYQILPISSMSSLYKNIAV